MASVASSPVTPRRTTTDPTLSRRATQPPDDPSSNDLFVHPRAEIFAFIIPGSLRPGSSSVKQKIREVPWRTNRDTVEAVGQLRLCIKSSGVPFLDCAGGKFNLPMMQGTECWCVDQESKFVVKGQQKMYRIELPFVTEEDKTKVENFKKALSKAIKYEKTSCPFKRGTQEELDLEDESEISPRQKVRLYNPRLDSVNSEPVDYWSKNARRSLADGDVPAEAEASRKERRNMPNDDNHSQEQGQGEDEEQESLKVEKTRTVGSPAVPVSVRVDDYEKVSTPLSPDVLLQLSSPSGKLSAKEATDYGWPSTDNNERVFYTSAGSAEPKVGVPERVASLNGVMESLSEIKVPQYSPSSSIEDPEGLSASKNQEEPEMLATATTPKDNVEQERQGTPSPARDLRPLATPAKQANDSVLSTPEDKPLHSIVPHHSEPVDESSVAPIISTSINLLNSHKSPTPTADRDMVDDKTTEPIVDDADFVRTTESQEPRVIAAEAQDVDLLPRIDSIVVGKKATAAEEVAATTLEDNSMPVATLVSSADPDPQEELIASTDPTHEVSIQQTVKSSVEEDPRSAPVSSLIEKLEHTPAPEPLQSIVKEPEETASSTPRQPSTGISHENLVAEAPARELPASQPLSDVKSTLTSNALSSIEPIVPEPHASKSEPELKSKPKSQLPQAQVSQPPPPKQSTSPPPISEQTPQQSATPLTSTTTPLRPSTPPQQPQPKTNPPQSPKPIFTTPLTTPSKPSKLSTAVSPTSAQNYSAISSIFDSPNDFPRLSVISQAINILRGPPSGLINILVSLARRIGHDSDASNAGYGSSGISGRVGLTLARNGKSGMPGSWGWEDSEEERGDDFDETDREGGDVGVKDGDDVVGEERDDFGVPLGNDGKARRGRRAWGNVDSRSSSVTRSTAGSGSVTGGGEFQDDVD